MIHFAAAVSTSHDAIDGAKDAAGRARASLGDATPALVVCFASPAYDDLTAIPVTLEAELGRLPLAGGTSGGAVFDSEGVVPKGVLVVLLGGEGVRATTATAPLRSPDLLDVVPAGSRILAEADRAASEGFEEALCLAFAPGVRVDGEAFVAAVRKGTGARMQLAGGLTGDDFTFDRTRVFADGEARADRAVMAGVFTRSNAGVAARHGLRPVGPRRLVTRTDGPWLLELDGRRALDAWVTDVRASDGRPPAGGQELLVYLANHNPLGVDVPSLIEPIVRAPMALRADGAVLLAAAMPEGTRVRIMRASAGEMLEASRAVADVAHERVGASSSGALVLACSGRLAALGSRFAEEPEVIARSLQAPVAGTCVFGEIARAHREVDAFHNTTAVVVAWPR